MNTLKETTRKTLIAQTSDQLYNKLVGGKLMGMSKDIALEILTERKGKGKFDKDLSGLGGEKVAATEVKVEGAKAPKVKKEKVKKEPKVKKEKVASKRSVEFSDFKAKFKKDQEVKFTPFRQKKEVKGTVVSSYPVGRKKGDSYVEAVKIRVGDTLYEKNAASLELVK